MKFCEKLKALRISVGYGFNDFWKEAKISNVYLSGLENGTKPPPPPDRQRDFIRILKEKQPLNEDEVNEFYDLAAKERNELPADIVVEYDYKKALIEIRKLIKENKK